MLPAPLQFVIAMIAYAINQRMARRVDYLQEEVRVLKETLTVATGKGRIAFSAEQRRRLALKGKALTAEERRACCQIVRPETILAWFRQLGASKYDSSKVRHAGRPRKKADIRRLVLKLARDNPGWGYTKIRDALRGLKIEIGRTTVANMLAEAGIEPAPERNRKRTWTRFLRSHWETLYACDFFSVEVLSAFGTVRHMVFFVMDVKSRAHVGTRSVTGGPLVTLRGCERPSCSAEGASTTYSPAEGCCTTRYTRDSASPFSRDRDEPDRRAVRFPRRQRSRRRESRVPLPASS
jgi:hypothetical protein